MLRKHDLSAMAEELDTPFMPEVIESLGGVEASLFVCDGQKGWHRRADAAELAVILEGVMTLDGADGLVVADEGDAVRIPEGIGLKVQSGMRTNVILIHESDALSSANGRPSLPPGAPRPPLSKSNVAVDVLSSDPFHWREAGTVGEYRVVASRLVGAAKPFKAAGPTLAIVYRGVLDYRSGTETGSVVGSEALFVPTGTPVSLSSERGATVLLVVGKQAELPAPSVAEGGGERG
ncbi:MAG: hypothetical protein ACK2T6_01655 [Anaerolineae bacterium]